MKILKAIAWGIVVILAIAAIQLILA